MPVPFKGLIALLVPSNQSYKGFIMPSFTDIQRIMDKYNLSYDQSVRCYWFCVEGYGIDRAVSIARKCHA